MDGGGSACSRAVQNVGTSAIRRRHCVRSAKNALQGLCAEILRCAQVRAQGTYISDKLDLLIEYLLVDPFQNLYRRIFKHDVRFVSHHCLLIQPLLLL